MRIQEDDVICCLMGLTIAFFIAVGIGGFIVMLIDMADQILHFTR